MRKEKGTDSARPGAPSLFRRFLDSRLRIGSLRRLLAGGVALAVGGLGFLLTPGADPVQERNLSIVAAQYAYDPPVIRVNRGDTLRLRFVSQDVVHGFYLEGHDIDIKITPMESAVEVTRPSQPGRVEKLEEVVLTVPREGKFRFRCSQTCGSVHPFMQGELIVGPNRLLPTSLSLVLGMLMGGLVLAAWPPEQA